MRDNQGMCVTNVTRSAEDENSVTDEVQNLKMSSNDPGMCSATTLTQRDQLKNEIEQLYPGEDVIKSRIDFVIKYSCQRTMHLLYSNQVVNKSPPIPDSDVLCCI